MAGALASEPQVVGRTGRVGRGGDDGRGMLSLE
jgi:hypothetical protein